MHASARCMVRSVTSSCRDVQIESSIEAIRRATMMCSARELDVRSIDTHVYAIRSIECAALRDDTASYVYASDNFSMMRYVVIMLELCA